jgi:hypothetical protein
MPNATNTTLEEERDARLREILAACAAAGIPRQCFGCPDNEAQTVVISAGVFVALLDVVATARRPPPAYDEELPDSLARLDDFVKGIPT